MGARGGQERMLDPQELGVTGRSECWELKANRRATRILNQCHLFGPKDPEFKFQFLSLGFVPFL